MDLSRLYTVYMYHVSYGEPELDCNFLLQLYTQTQIASVEGKRALKTYAFEWPQKCTCYELLST